MIDSKNPTAGQCLQETGQCHLNALLNSLHSRAESVREQACVVLLRVVNNYPKVDRLAVYILEAVFECLGGGNLDGFAHLAPEQRPNPAQLPCVMVKMREESEYVRGQLVKVVGDLLLLLDQPVLASVLPLAIEVLKVLMMDPVSEIQIATCDYVVQLADMHSELLQKLAVELARAALLPLSSKKSKPVLAGLRAVRQLLIAAGTDGVLVLDLLAGTRDPNMVPIKDFYTASYNVNYLAHLSGSYSPQVKLLYLETLSAWLSLPNRDELLCRLMPYFLSFLSDESPAMQEKAVECLE